MRFANRVPLTFDQGSCAITEALKSVDWKRYGIRDFDNTPLTLFVNIISTQVPYLSTGKQSVAPEPEIVQEVRQATMTLARKLQKHIRAKVAAKEKAMRSKIFEDYVPVIIEESAKLAETEVPEYNEILAKVTKRALAELLGEKVETDDEEEIIEEEDSLIEELDEFGHKVDKSESNIGNRNTQATLTDNEDKEEE
jgi:DNA topoisomerase-6 subunit B